MSGPTLAPHKVQQLADGILESSGLAAVVHIQVAREPADIGLVPPPGPVPTGVMHGGQITLFSHGLEKDSDVVRAVFHEVFHLGLGKSLTQSHYSQRMLRLLLDPAVRKYAARWKLSNDGQNCKGRMPVNNWQALAVEEGLADIAENTRVRESQLGTKERAAWALGSMSSCSGTTVPLVPAARTASARTSSSARAATLAHRILYPAVTLGTLAHNPFCQCALGGNLHVAQHAGTVASLHQGPVDYVGVGSVCRAWGVHGGVLNQATPCGLTPAKGQEGPLAPQSRCAYRRNSRGLPAALAPCSRIAGFVLVLAYSPNGSCSALSVSRRVKPASTRVRACAKRACSALSRCARVSKLPPGSSM